MVYEPTLFNTDPYYDDFSEDKNFLRLLFNPGKAVQARELTQLQTNIQSQMQRFGDHILNNGSRVIGGEISNQDVTFIRFLKQDPSGGADIDISNFFGTDLVISIDNDQDTRRAKVIHGISADTSTDDDYYVMCVQYMNGGSGGLETFGGSEVVKGICGSNVYKAKIATTDGSPATDATVYNGVTGTAKLTTINDGIFFVDGFFVKSGIQSVSPYSLTGSDPLNFNIRDFSSPTSRVGYTTNKSIVTSSDDYTLRDPASGAYNYNAPGADRYKIKLELDFKNFINNATQGSTAFGDKNFFEIVRFVDGNVQLKKEYTDYSEIEKTLARRTHDESGSYTVKPFEIDIRESLDNLGGPFSSENGGDKNKVAVGLQAGKAYVYGYELETQGTQYVLVDKARENTSVTSLSMNNVKFGQYVKVYGGTQEGAVGDAGEGGPESMTGGFALTDNFPKLMLEDPSGVTGIARVRQIIHNDPSGSILDGSMTGENQTYNLHLFDISLGGITAFGNVVKFGGTTELGAGSLTAGFVVAPGGTNSNGTALLDPSYGAAIFPVPIGNSVKEINNLTYRTLKSFTFTQTLSTNQIPLDTGNNALSFVSANLGAIGPADKQNFYLLVCADGGGDASGNGGERVNTDSIKFDKIDSQTIKIGVDGGGVGALAAGTYTLLCAVDVGGDSLLYREKTFIPTSGDLADIYGSSSEHLVTNNGDNLGLSGSTGSYYFSVDHRDIYDIESIVDIGDGTVTSRLGTDTTDVKAAFLLDNGQKDNYYDFGKLYLNPAWITGGGVLTGDVQLRATYSRFNHDSGVGPFLVNSYDHNAGISFDNIPIYTSPSTGKSFSLRNCIDFRGTAQTDDTITPDGLVPRAVSAVAVSDYSYHLARIDKIILTKERQFDVIRGISSLNPQEPPDREDAMTLYVLTVPAYTYNVGDVTSKFIENKRYTMRDIGAIEKRVENLEYYTSLSLLEQETEARSITDSAGNDIFKNGILVDAFRGHSVGDVLNADYTCSIDYENGHLRPPFTSKALKLEKTAMDGLIKISSAGVATLDYTVNSSFVWQPLASGSISANPFSIPSFMGHIEFDDPCDEWYDQSTKPLVKINTQGENDRWKIYNESRGYGFGTQWNDWEGLWSGRTVTRNDLYNNRGRDYLNAFTTGTTAGNIENRIKLTDSSAIRSTETQKSNEGRVGIRVRKLPERLEKIVNDKLVDVSVVPYMRAKTITLSAYGMKPNTEVFTFFDGDDVSSYCGPLGGVVTDSIFTDGEGKVIDMFFSIPAETYRTGERLFRLTDDFSNTMATTTTAADGIYYALGIVQQRDGDLCSTRPVVTRRQVVNDEAIVRDAFDRDRYINTSSNSLWIDPLSQIITINRNWYPNGAYVDSLDLFFQSIDENVPITVEIRPTIGGYPHMSQSLPFSTISLIPDTAEVRADYPVEDTYTRFTFKSPVYLAPGEYSICVKTSSDLYKLYIAELGEAVLDSGVVISEQPYNGPLFTAQNTGISVANINKALKFKLNSCTFVTGEGDISFEIPESEYNTEVGNGISLLTDVFKVNSGEYIPFDTSLSYNFNLTSTILGANLITNENIYLADSKEMTSESDFTLNATLSTDDVNVSPMIDIKRLDYISVNNVINNMTNVATNGELDAVAPEGALDTDGIPSKARYITRRVTLADGFESSNFKVLMSVSKPAKATIQVFIKALGIESDTPFEEIPYTQMTADSTIPDSGNDYDFSDVTFSLASNFDNIIKTFAVKICMYSSSSTDVPSIRDFRTIALAT